MRGAILILNGPGLSSRATVKQIEEACAGLCAELQLDLDFRYADDPATMERWLREDGNDFDAVIVNPAGCPAFALDPVAGNGTPVIEVHLENIFGRDNNADRTIGGPPGKVGFICGLGHRAYTLAIRSLARSLDKQAAT